MALWNAVWETNEAFTKTLNYGRKFTAIDAHYQVLRVTEMFGPVGENWGWTIKSYQVFSPLIIVHLNVWMEKRENCIEVLSAAELFKGDKPDHDAPKKAVTDALTKAFSYWGFNADVFLGKFDGNKYVDHLVTASPGLKKEAGDPEMLALIEGCANEIGMPKEDMLRGCSGITRRPITDLLQLTKDESEAVYKRLAQKVKEYHENGF